MAWTIEDIEAAITTSAAALGYQCEVVNSFICGSDVFVSLHTGSGKSLCYWVLPGAFNLLKQTDSSVVLVVSPLIALMKDQVERLKGKGVKAVYGGDQCEMEIGHYQLLFLSPESLLTSQKWRDVLMSDVY